MRCKTNRAARPIRAERTVMYKDTVALSTEQQDQDMKRRIRKVLSGSSSGMDEESLRAGVVLQVQVETRQILLELLQTHNIYAEVGEDGVPECCYFPRQLAGRF